MTKSEKREYDKQYRLKNREKKREYDKQYSLENREKKIEYNRQYRLENTLIDSILIYGLCDKRDPNKVINYVGQTNNPKRRFAGHKTDARRGYHQISQHTSKGMIEMYEYIRDEIGVENLEMISLEEVPTDQADFRENYWMDKLKTRFNVRRNNE